VRYDPIEALAFSLLCLFLEALAIVLVSVSSERSKRDRIETDHRL
jgi:hypothetical protein